LRFLLFIELQKNNISLENKNMNEKVVFSLELKLAFVVIERFFEVHSDEV
jgi:hypothetical protein